MPLWSLCCLRINLLLYVYYEELARPFAYEPPLQNLQSINAQPYATKAHILVEAKIQNGSSSASDVRLAGRLLSGTRVLDALPKLAAATEHTHNDWLNDSTTSPVASAPSASAVGR